MTMLLSDAPIESERFRVEGKFVGGCEWQSNDTFATKEAAQEWIEVQRKTAPTPSTNYRIVNADKAAEDGRKV
jgi:hypothetical protein